MGDERCQEETPISEYNATQIYHTFAPTFKLKTTPAKSTQKQEQKCLSAEILQQTLTKVAIEALPEQQTLAEIASKHKLHQNKVSSWKKDAAEAMTMISQDKRRKEASLKEAEEQIHELQRMVGQLTMQRDWLKENRFNWAYELRAI